MGFEQFEQPQSDPRRTSVFADAGIVSPTDNKMVVEGRAALQMPTGFPDVSTSAQTSASDAQPPSNPEHRGDNAHPWPTDPGLPGLPPPSRGHRQIVHLTPGRYIDVPYPEDFSIRNGVTYGHVSIKVPGWVPGAHPYRNR